jgi:hypothetical protein
MNYLKTPVLFFLTASPSGSVGFTIMGKTADLTVVRQSLTGSTRKFAVQRELYFEVIS